MTVMYIINVRNTKSRAEKKPLVIRDRTVVSVKKVTPYQHEETNEMRQCARAALEY